MKGGKCETMKVGILTFHDACNYGAVLQAYALTQWLQMNKIDVEIIGIDKEKQRVSLSLKSLEENPWLKAQDTIQNGITTKGKITGIKSFGVFVEVYPKVEGLLNKAQVKEFIKKFEKEPELNDELDVVIKKFDVENQKINLEIAE